MSHQIRSRFSSHLMPKLTVVLLVIFCLGLLRPVAASPLQQDSVQPTVVFQAWYPGLTMEGAFSNVLIVRDFPTGTGTGLHSHGGPGLILITNGVFTTREDNTDTRYGAGKSFAEMPGHIHEGFNDDDTTAQIISSYLLTEGAKVAIPQGESDRPAATKLYEAQFPGITLDGTFTELMRVVEFPPGATTGPHVHHGPTLLLMLDGALTVRQDGGETVYQAGQSWMETADHVHEAINTGDSTARLIAVYLLPMAEPATSVQQ